MIKRALATLTALVLGVGTALVGFAAPASAHVPDVDIYCGWVSYGFDYYKQDSTNRNRFALYLDDMSQPVLDVTFGATLSPPVQFFFDENKPHTVRYVIDASDGTDHDKDVTVVTTPCFYPDRHADASCTSVDVDWGGPLDAGFSVEVGLRVSATETRQITAAIVPGVTGGFGPDTLGVQFTDWQGNETLQPLDADPHQAELLANSGEFTFDYPAYAGTLSAFRVEAVELAGKAVNLGRQLASGALDCGFTAISPSYSVDPASCSASGKLVLPTIDGMSWIVQQDTGLFDPVSGSLDPTGPGIFQLRAVPDFGYTISGPSDFDDVAVPYQLLAGCNLTTLALVYPSATMEQATCFASANTYTLSDTDGVLWFVDGDPDPVKPGTYQAGAGAAIEVQAMLLDASYGWDGPPDPKWTFTFAAAASGCDLTTLAMTGAASPLLWIAGAVLLLGSGAGVYLTRRFWGARAS